MEEPGSGQLGFEESRSLEYQNRSEVRLSDLREHLALKELVVQHVER